jgi:beta-lactamase class A
MSRWFTQKILSRHFLIGVLVGVGLCSIALLIHSAFFNAAPTSRGRAYRQQDSSYTFIKPLLFYDSPETEKLPEYTDLEHQIKNYIATNSQSLNASNVSVYFRDLNQGHWVGLSETEMYMPHSLLKIAYLIAYLKKAESTPGLLDKKLTYTKELRDQIDTVSLENNSDLVVGQSYTIETLLEAMITKSDNVAKDILLASIDTADINKLFTDIGIPVPTSDDYTISVKTYASFFRILYNATYLNRDFSEMALKLLNNAEFEYGIRSTIPKEVNISHKYGIDAPQTQGQGLELHDCGIIYKPSSPYLLCVMTRGQNIQGLSTMIQGISALVYKEF